MLLQRHCGAIQGGMLVKEDSGNVAIMKLCEKKTGCN